MVASEDALSFRTVSVARVPEPHNGAVSGVLVPRPMAFLAVQLVLDGYPLAGREVTFHEVEPDGSSGAPLGDPLFSDDLGVARLSRLVPVGLYICKIDGQIEPAHVGTVNRWKDAYVLGLPLGSEAVGHYAQITDDAADAEGRR